MNYIRIVQAILKTLLSSVVNVKFFVRHSSELKGLLETQIREGLTRRGVKLCKPLDSPRPNITPVPLYLGSTLKLTDDFILHAGAAKIKADNLEVNIQNFYSYVFCECIYVYFYTYTNDLYGNSYPVSILPCIDLGIENVESKYYRIYEIWWPRTSLEILHLHLHLTNFYAPERLMDSDIQLKSYDPITFAYSVLAAMSQLTGKDFFEGFQEEYYDRHLRKNVDKLLF